MFNFLDVVSAHVECVEVGEAVEEPEGGDLPDAVVGEDEVGGGGGDPAGDVRQPAVGAVHLGAVTPALGGAQRVLLAPVGGRPGLACNMDRYCRYYFIFHRYCKYLQQAEMCVFIRPQNKLSSDPVHNI